MHKMSINRIIQSGIPSIIHTRTPVHVTIWRQFFFSVDIEFHLYQRINCKCCFGENTGCKAAEVVFEREIFLPFIRELTCYVICQNSTILMKLLRIYKFLNANTGIESEIRQRRIYSKSRLIRCLIVNLSFDVM